MQLECLMEVYSRKAVILIKLVLIYIVVKYQYEMYVLISV